MKNTIVFGLVSAVVLCLFAFWLADGDHEVFNAYSIIAIGLITIVGFPVFIFLSGIYTFIIEPALERKHESKRGKRRERMLSNLHRADTDDDSDEPAWLKRSKKRNQRQEARRLRIMKRKDPLAYRATINGRTKAQQAAVEQRERKWESV